MKDEQTPGQKAQSRSLAEYVADLARSRIQVLTGGPGTFWTRYAYACMIRNPKFCLTPPTSNEVREILWRGWAPFATYLLETDERHPANTWLYLCTDHDYTLDKLSGNMRREVSRGLKELTISSLLSDQVLAHGIQAFCETRRRLGLSDGTPKEFHRRFVAEASLPEVVYLGAWKDNQLAAFLSILEVDDWVEITGCFSIDSLRQCRPNQALFYSAFSHYLVERRCCLVCGGLSSILANSNDGLHIFKKRVGYEARCTDRAFVLHPLLRPFANRLTLWGLNTALRFKPGDRHLKKAAEALACMLEDACWL